MNDCSYTFACVTVSNFSRVNFCLPADVNFWYLLLDSLVVAREVTRAGLGSNQLQPVCFCLFVLLNC